MNRLDAIVLRDECSCVRKACLVLGRKGGESGSDKVRGYRRLGGLVHDGINAAE